MPLILYISADSHCPLDGFVQLFPSLHRIKLLFVKYFLFQYLSPTENHFIMRHLKNSISIFWLFLVIPLHAQPYLPEEIDLNILKKKYDISLNLKVGQVYYQTINTESDFLSIFNDQEMLISTVFESRLSYKVSKAFKDHYYMSVQYESISMVNKSPMATFEFSSEKGDSTDIMSLTLKELVRKPFTLMLDKNGKINEIVNLDTIFSSLSNILPNNNSTQSQKLSEQMNEFFGGEVLIGNFELLSAIYPDKKVVLNETWSNPVSLGGRLSGTSVNLFELYDITQDYAFIKGESMSYIKDEDASMEVMGKLIHYNLDGGMSYECKVDNESGWVTEATIEQDYKGELLFEEDEAWNNRRFPIAIRNHIHITNIQEL